MTKWIHVSSEAILRVGYDPGIHRMYIDFRDSFPQYTFCGVPENVFRDFVNASSVGGYYHRHIRGRYQC